MRLSALFVCSRSCHNTNPGVIRVLRRQNFWRQTCAEPSFLMPGAYTSKFQAMLTKPSSEFIVTTANPRTVDNLNTRVELGPDEILLAASLFHCASTGDEGGTGKGLWMGRMKQKGGLGSILFELLGSLTAQGGFERPLLCLEKAQPFPFISRRFALPHRRDVVGSMNGAGLRSATNKARGITARVTAGLRPRQVFSRWKRRRTLGNFRPLPSCGHGDLNVKCCKGKSCATMMVGRWPVDGKGRKSWLPTRWGRAQTSHPQALVEHRP